jgi:nucleotide-binding universal stress UspA family protein
MGLKDILVYLDDGASNPERINAAFALAKTHGAHLTAVTLASVIPAHLKISDEGILAGYSEQAAEQRVADFIEATKKEGISSNARVIQGKGAEEIAKFARNFDLIMLRQANPNNRNYALVEEVAQQVILLGGRPIFFMPYIGAHRIPCKKVMIAWDGTPAASRAVHDALPLIKTINNVIILVVENNIKKTTRGEPLADDLATHLGRHRVNATVRRVTAGTFDVPTVLLNEISENDIDLLVMGGYGTPSLKQKIFGGVTRTLLSSMIIPVLMSH